MFNSPSIFVWPESAIFVICYKPETKDKIGK